MAAFFFRLKTAGAPGRPNEVRMTSEFDEAVNRISQVVMFENWLRFYFIAEEDDKLFIRIPTQAMEKLHANYPKLVGLAERLNGEEIDHKTSMQAVVMFTATEMNGLVLPEPLIEQIFDSPRFHLDLQLFSSWVQSHEEQLDAGFMEFSTWQSMFEEWRKSDKVQEYAAEVAGSLFRTVKTPDTTQ